MGSITEHGYRIVYVGKGHHLADVRGYAYEHRVVGERKTGRWLLPGEQVHHISGDKLDNRPENLEVLTQAEHRAEHRLPGSRLRLPGEPNPTAECECGCGATFVRFDDANRPRRFVEGHNTNLRPAPTMEAIVSAVAAGVATRAELIAALDLSKQAIVVALSRLVRRGALRRVGRGVYALPEAVHG